MSRYRMWRSFVVAGFVITAINSAYGQSAVALENGIQLQSNLALTRTFTDNFFYNDQKQVSAQANQATAYVGLSRTAENISLHLRGTGDYIRYDLPDEYSNTQDSYSDGQIYGDFDWTAGTRNRLGFHAQYQRSYDPIGLGAAESAQSADPNKKSDADNWGQSIFGGTYRFGAEDAPINLELTGNSLSRSYTNHRDVTQYLDFTTDQIVSAAYFRYSPKTSLIAEIGHDWTRFDEHEPSTPFHDTDETRFRVGVRWKASAKTTGDIRVGYVTKKFKGGDQDVNGLSWLGSLIWNPAARSTFSFSAGRSSQESYLSNATSLDNRSFKLTWAQQFGEHFSLSVGPSYLKTDFQGSSGTFRTDDVTILNASLEYSVVKYLSLLAAYNRANRDSSFSAVNYLVNSGYIGIRLIP